jgi:hypothetical protein
MTTDKLANALIAIIEDIKPDASITVADGRDTEEISLPMISVAVEDAERHSLALPGVMKCSAVITLRVHSGDATDRAELKTWADTIEQSLNGTTVVRDAITNSGLGVKCDYFQMHGGVTSWNETTFEAAFDCEAWIVRTS